MPTGWSRSGTGTSDLLEPSFNALLLSAIFEACLSRYLSKVAGNCKGAIH